MIFECHFKERRRNKETKKQASPCNHKTESNNFSNVPSKTERSKKKKKMRKNKNQFQTHRIWVMKENNEHKQIVPETNTNYVHENN